MRELLLLLLLSASIEKRVDLEFDLADLLFDFYFFATVAFVGCVRIDVDFSKR